jgi:DNA-binding beta-propeller fold protein YncE
MKPNAVIIALAIVFLTPVVWAQTLGTTNLLEGNLAGSDSAVLSVTPMNFPWTATTNASWLHLSTGNQSGMGSTNVIFTFDADSGATRTGTLTIAGQTLTVTQAGSTYVTANPVTTLVSLGFNFPNSVVVDSAGNVYAPSAYYNMIEEWMLASNTVTTLVSSGLSSPIGLAMDGAGNLYIGDYGDNSIKEWSVTNGAVTTLVSSGLSFPEGVAVDGAGNVYIADYGNNAIKEWSVASHNVTTLVSGLKGPTGVAVDGIGNVYIADSGNNAIKEWNVANSNVTTLVSSGLNLPTGVAVDGSGNAYIADQNDGAIKKWTAASNAVTTLVFSGWTYYPHDVAVDGAGNIYITGTSTILELPHAFVDSTAKSETPFAGSDTLPVVLPATANLTGPFAPVSDSAWLTITGITNGVVSFAFTANTSESIRTANITLLGQTIPVTQMAPIYSLGTTNLLEGNLAGNDSVVLSVTPMNFPWTATTNAFWLHLSAGNQSGAGSTNVIFTFDANLGATRTGTLTIAGQTLTVTQAGSTYVAANPVTSLVPSALSIVNFPTGVAVDGVGNVYIGDTINNRIAKWSIANNTLTTLVASGLNQPYGVAVDGTGNVYVADFYNNAIKEWKVASSNVTTLVSSGLGNPRGLAVDGVGNVYIADFINNAIKEWTAANSNVTTLVSSGLAYPEGVAVDGAGNVYIADTVNNEIKEWNVANGSVTTLVSSGLSGPWGVAVDGAGNVYIADTYNNAIKKWNMANNTVSTLVATGLYQPHGIAVDVTGNVYIADTINNAIKELPHAFVDATAKSETPFAGSDTLPVVLPATANLTGPFAPVSDSAWLTITGSANGVVSFAFTATTTNRMANITLLGQTIPVTQIGPAYSLGTTNLLEGNLTGSDSVVLSVTPTGAIWTATPNNFWLHLSAGNQNGAGSTNVIFTFDANSGATRTGTLTIAGQTITVTQAGSTYVAANPLTTLVSSGLLNPEGVAVDGAGNVYIADTGNQAIKKWTVANNTVTTLVPSGLVYPSGVAVDGAGNVFVTDTFHNAIKEWVAASNTVTMLVDSNLSLPFGLAVDGVGNVYIADTYNSAIREWIAASNTVTTLVASGLSLPFGAAVDSAGNVYIADTLNNAIEEWTTANNTVTALALGLSQPRGVAVDGAGNVYIADQANNAIKEWMATSNTVTTLVASGLNYPWGVAVDGAGNIYMADYGNNAIKELPHAFVDSTAKAEMAAAGDDSLPVVLPATANLTGPFTPVSDSDWLTITGSINGVVSFAFTDNPLATRRTANITLLGQTIPVTQSAAPVTSPNLTGLTILGNGAFQFGFINNQDASFTVLTTTNLSLPLTNWTVLGTPTNNGFGQYQFTDLTATNGGQRFYRVSSP